MAWKIPISIVFGIASVLGRSLRVLRSVGRDANPKTQIVWPPSGWGSLGDEGILSQVLLSGRQRGVEISIVLQSHKGVSWRGRLIVDKDIEHLTIISSTNAFEMFSLALKLLRALVISRDLVVIGADIIDGAYGDSASIPRLALAHCAALAGLRCTITGFSFSESATVDSIAAFRRLSTLVYFTSRDPVSKFRFEKAVGRTAELSADTVFLIDEGRGVELISGTLNEWLLEKRASGAAVIGLNLNDHALRMAEKPALREPDTYVTAVVSGLRVWREKAGLAKVAVLIFPSDNRDHEIGRSDFGLARKFQEAMHHETWAEVELIDYPIALVKAQSILPSLDLLISCRMHACILALNAKVPIVAVEYVGKFEGFFEHFSPRRIGVLLSPNEFLESEVLGGAIHDVWPRRMEYSKNIALGLPEVQSRARNNYRPL